MSRSLESSPSGSPRLSVVVPVYNSTDVLTDCLAALAQSAYESFEVLVVDDGSTDAIEPIVHGFGFDYARIEGPGGPARARNHGAKMVDGEYLVFIDADVCVHSDTLRRFAETFSSDESIDAVIGSYDEAPQKPNLISQYKNLFHHFVHQQCDGDIATFWTGCGAIKREVFVIAGGFDEVRYRRPAIEDIELGTWLTSAGYRIVLNSEIKAKHLKRWTLVNLVRTDLFDRGIPWTRLMLRSGGMVNSLNVTVAQRISVALVFLAIATLFVAIVVPKAMLVSGAILLIVTLLNLDFYRFFYRHSGAWFTIRIAPLHWLYFCYCGLGFALGLLLHLLDRTRNQPLTPVNAIQPNARLVKIEDHVH